MDIDQRFADIFFGRLSSGSRADIAEGFDPQLLLPSLADSGLDVDSVHTAEFSAGIFEFSRLREPFTGLGQLTQFLDQAAETPENASQIERKVNRLAQQIRIIRLPPLCFILLDFCHNLLLSFFCSAIRA